MSRSLVRLLSYAVLFLFSAQAVAQDSGESLGDVARKYRDQQTSVPVIKSTDAKALFREMDTILNFASADTGYSKPAMVNRVLLSRNDLQKMFDDSLNQDKDSEARLLNAELVLKKLGLLRPEFEFSKYMHQDFSKEFAGLYSFKTKTMYLMDWVPLEQQREVMAHELTHALQDKNFDLQKFHNVGVQKKQGSGKESQFQVGLDNDSERGVARKAVVEGQAMLVLLDYEIGELTKGEGLTPDRYKMVMEFMQSKLLDYDMRISLKQAPRVLSDTLRFPYREGLAFEVEALKKDRRAAFAGMFERPPRSTHEVLEPEAYFKHENPAVVVIPDLTPVLSDAYVPYDSGVMGEFDVYVMAKEFGRENDIYSVAQKWKGGSYVVARRKPTDNSAKPTVADLALLYVSRWRTPEAAVRFAEIYRTGLLRHASKSDEVRYDANCALGDDGCKGLQWGVRLMTDEGLVSLEVWPGNTLIISQSFEDETLSKLRHSVLTKQVAEANTVEQKELSMKLCDLPEFAALQEAYSQEVVAAALELLKSAKLH